MRLCMTHWTNLRTAIEDAGIGDNIAKTGAEAARRMADGEFEPLAVAQTAIIYAVIKSAPEVLTGDPETCPACYGNEAHALECTDDDCPIEKGDDDGYGKYIIDWAVTGTVNEKAKMN